MSEAEELIDVENDLKPLQLENEDHQLLSLLELTTQPNDSCAAQNQDFDFALPAKSAQGKNSAIDDISKYTYPLQMTNPYDRENWTISKDHCYARPWNWRPETSFLRPTKTLFVPKLAHGQRKSSNPLAPLRDCDEFVDVEADFDPPSPIYDTAKAKIAMEECEKYALAARKDQENEDWEEKISKTNWTSTQNRIFSGIVDILNGFLLAKLAYTDARYEVLIGRTIVDKAVQRVRRLLSTVSWDPKTTQWLHQMLIDNLTGRYLGCYLDILQTLKSKLPSFVEKMMYSPNSALRMGSLSNSSLFSMLEKPWDPVDFCLNQDKPKKLPGNPIIIVVPSSTVMSKRTHKWIKLFSHLGTVVTVPVNFGSSTHRMSMMNCIDQMFSVTRGKIQDVRVDYPGRNIVLVGLSAGATLALQVAQVEPVTCVLSLGFSLLTAEGRRGEPDDNILELQCPVLFVIGQCSNTSLQEDVEDLRERMRVETGLIVVGSADDYLRVNKKKKISEGITQSIVDRCIVDEIGEFISGIIMSPFPPQIRQSPTRVPAEPTATTKKSKAERKRYNSNASSLDSEPPSPTPRISRPGLNNSPPNLGRPPGSKSKSRLETKWAQQIAQGNNAPGSPASSPTPPYPTAATPDTSSNDSSLYDKPASQTVPNPQPSQPVKKLKTLKPVASGADKKPTTPANSPGKTQPATQSGTAPARMQAYGLNRSAWQSGNLSTLLQGGIKTIPPTQPKSAASGIKVLENITLNSNAAGKLISNNGRTFDLSKITVINSVKGANTSVGNVLVLPDGKLKTVHRNLAKGNAGMSAFPPGAPRGRGRYVTKRTPLAGHQPKSHRLPKKPVYMPNSTIQPALAPPTNLTTQDIMDLPIIFADDDSVLDTPLTTSAVPTTPVPSTPKIVTSTAAGKFVLVNKQTSSGQGNFIITPTGARKTMANTLNLSKQTPKYTKIILSSKRSNVDDLKVAKLQNLSSEITVKRVASVERMSAPVRRVPDPIDLENEIEASKVPKPTMTFIDNLELNEKAEEVGLKRDVSSFLGEESSEVSSKFIKMN